MKSSAQNIFYIKFDNLSWRHQKKVNDPRFACWTNTKMIWYFWCCYKLRHIAMTIDINVSVSFELCDLCAWKEVLEGGICYVGIPTCIRACVMWILKFHIDCFIRTAYVTTCQILWINVQINQRLAWNSDINPYHFTNSLLSRTLIFKTG